MALIQMAAIGPNLTNFGAWRFDLAGEVRPVTEASRPVEVTVGGFVPGGVVEARVLVPSLSAPLLFLARDGTFGLGAAGSGLVADGAGRLADGTLRLVTIGTGTRLDQGLLDIRADAGVLVAAARTASRADDDRFLRSLLSEDDVIRLREGNTAADVVASGGGDDIAMLQGGADRFDGGLGRDLGLGGSGHDTLSGGAGNDVLLGEYGDDKVFGGGGDDLLAGDFGADVLTGGAGADRFVFGDDSARDRVADFEDGIDRILLVEGALRFSDLRLTAIDADSTVVAWATGSLRVDGVARAALTAADFGFGAVAAAGIGARIDAVLDANAYVLAG
jgi:Ca2+-binding RTX toxin-like protein